MAEFAGVYFVERGDGRGSGRGVSSAAQGRRDIIPGSNPPRLVVQRNFTSRFQLDTEAECTPAQLAALRALWNTEGALSLSKTSGTALLTKVDPSGIFDHDHYVVQLSFRLTQPSTHGGYGSSYGTYP